MIASDLNRIVCGLTLRLRSDPEICAAMQARFGFVPERCDYSEVKRIGRDALAAFWLEQIESTPLIRDLAAKLVGIHKTISPAPGKLTDAIELWRALMRELKSVLGGEHGVTREEAARRLNICHSCPQLQDGRCSKCHCYVRIKTKFGTEHCPIDKW